VLIIVFLLEWPCEVYTMVYPIFRYTQISYGWLDISLKPSYYITINPTILSQSQRTCPILSQWNLIFSMVIHIFCEDFWINNEVSMFHGFYPIKIPNCLWMSMVSIWFLSLKRIQKIVARFTSAVPWGGFKGSGAEDWPMDGRYAAAGRGPDVEKPLGKAPEGRMEWFMEVNG
jgi:hypothetical protein